MRGWSLHIAFGSLALFEIVRGETLYHELNHFVELAPPTFFILPKTFYNISNGVSVDFVNSIKEDDKWVKALEHSLRIT